MYLSLEVVVAVVVLFTNKTLTRRLTIWRNGTAEKKITDHRKKEGRKEGRRYSNTHPNPLPNPLGVCVPVYTKRRGWKGKGKGA